MGVCGVIPEEIKLHGRTSKKKKRLGGGRITLMPPGKKDAVL